MANHGSMNNFFGALRLIGGLGAVALAHLLSWRLFRKSSEWFVSCCTFQVKAYRAEAGYS